MTDTVGQPVIGFMPYDTALKEFFTMKLYPDMQKPREYIILTPVEGPPRIEFANQEQLNPNNEPVEGRINNTVRLPAIAVTQLNWSFDLSRWTRANFRRLGWTEQGNRVIQSPQLVPVDVMYQVDLISKYRITMNQMVKNILIKFTNREVALDVDLGSVWGKRVILLTDGYDGPINLSDIEPVDKDRIVRMAFTFTLHAWIIPDAYTAPTVKKYLADLYLGNSSSKYPNPSDMPPYPGWILEKEIQLNSVNNDENP